MEDEEEELIIASPFIEDSTAPLNPIEETLRAGVSIVRIEQLRKVLVAALIEAPSPLARSRRLIQVACQFEIGALFDGYFSPTYLASRFNSRRGLLTVDQTLQPYYGLINPSLADLRLQGLDPTVTNMWLQWFLQDDGRYRVAVAASICLVAALNDNGFMVEA